MDAPTYDELLAHYNMEKSIMKQTFDDEHLRQFSLIMDMLETLATFLGIPNSDITDIKNQGTAKEQRMRMLECWKQRCGFKATYEAMIKALLKINRADLAERVITLRRSSNAVRLLETATTNQSLPSPRESSLTSPTFPTGSSEIEAASLQTAMSSLSPATPNESTIQNVIPTLKKLEEKFYRLVVFIEKTLEHNKVSLDTITRRFSMLPQSVKRQHETDENYTATRRQILDSETIKKLFDNLTELKHWNYMTPDTLAHIVKDVKIDAVHKKINKYRDKLLAFKANTKLRELVGISFPVPDYCMELTMKVEGWEDKTIQEVEDRAVNIVRLRLGWKGVIPGCINVTFILMESVSVIPEKFFEDNHVISVQIDGNPLHRKKHIKTAHGKREVPATISQSLASPRESSLTSPTFPASSGGIEGASLQAAMSPLSLPATPNEYPTQDVISTLKELEEEFYDLVEFIEQTLENSEVSLDTITRRFRLLPQSVRRQHETDEYYRETRQKVLTSTSMKEVFDNLTELKHWNYMTPDTLAHILKDVKIDEVRSKVKEYEDKLRAFKANTKLRELVGISFPVPDYCIELTMEVEGWEDKTIQEVEDRAANIVQSGSNKVPWRLWNSKCETEYAVGGGRDVLILAPDLSLPHPEAVARRPGQLTMGDKQKLLSQGLPSKAQNELDIIKARYRQDKDFSIVKVKSGWSISYKEVLGSIEHVFNTTENDGVVLYYIGAGRRGTGDWCFEDGFITFSDITQLYLRASQNFQGRILTIVSDCSYSGCWVRDCMEFLDEQGVQPCGHKAREKGMIIKVFTSCKSKEIPTEYRHTVDGMDNEVSTGDMSFWTATQLLKTQTTNDIDSSELNCQSETINKPCTLPPGLTWRRLKRKSSVYMIKDI